MYLLLETIKILDGLPMHLQWHQERFEKSFFKLFGYTPKLKLESVVNIPDNYSEGTMKLRFLYNRDSFSINYQQYKKKEINSLQLVINNMIDYSLKYKDRNCLTKLLALKGDCDDILIVKNGLITDSSYTNIVFFDGNNWITPETPLLEGTARARLIAQKTIKEQIIKIEDLSKFKSFRLINAMMDFEDQNEIDIKNIRYK